jgi:hypothetical protein
MFAHGRRMVLLRTVVAAATVLAATAVATPATADETTVGYSPLRMNWDDHEPGLTSDTVTQPDFGALWTATLPSTTTTTPNGIYAQPLVADHEVIVATEEDQVSALDPATGALIWTRSLGVPWTPDPVCGDLVPHIGITSTPVYDPSSNSIFVVAKTAGPTAAAAVMQVHKLDADTGAEQSGWPLTIGGSSANGHQPFNPATANQRPGLLLMDGAVYFATASNCDHGPYVGFVGRVTTGSAPSLTLWSAESGSASDEAGIWQSGGGLMSDGAGRVFIATGNGISPTPTKGSTPPGTLAESVVRLAVGADGSMSAQDFFSPSDNTELDQDDADLGSGAPVALPAGFGSGSHRNLLVVAGKDGRVRLLDRNDLGGMGQGPGGTDAVVDATTLKGVWGRAAVFDGDTTDGLTDKHLVYLLPSTAPLEALTVSPDASGNPTLTAVAASSESFGYTSGSPIVTSDDGDPDTALVWVAVAKDATGADGMLEAFPAVPPTSGAWTPIEKFPLGTIAKFIQPATDNGRLFVGTRDGRVLAFGRPTTAAITASPTDFGDQPVGGPATTGTVSVTANATVTVDSVAISPSSAFTAAAPTPDLPATLSAGDIMTVPVSFTPSSAGTANGTLTVNATPADGTARDYPFSLSGTGTEPGVAASPVSLDFGAVPTGQSARLSATIQNTGTDPETVQTITAPTGQFSFFGAPPAPGFVLAPLSSVTITVQFSPTADADTTGSFTVTTDAGAGSAVTVPLTGTGFSGSPALTFSGPDVVGSAIDFGQVRPGYGATTTFTLTNSGTSTMTIDKAAVPSSPFVVPAPISEGQSIQPGDSLTITVTIRPTSAEPVHNSYAVTVNDGQGPHVLTLTANTSRPVGPLPGPLGCVTLKARIIANGTPIVDYDCDGTSAQRWDVGPDHSLALHTGMSSYCIDVPDSAVRIGTPIELYTCNRTKAQVWRFDPSGRIENPNSKLCLDVRNHSTQLNARLVLARCSTVATQQWDPSALLASRGEVSSGVGVTGQYCLTDPDSRTAAGTPLELVACAFGGGQLLARLGSTVRAAGQCMTVAHNSLGGGVWLARCSGSRAQVWTVGAGSSLYNPGARLCLDDPGSSVASGTHLWVYTCNRTAAQRWLLPS